MRFNVLNTSGTCGRDMFKVTDTKGSIYTPDILNIGPNQKKRGIYHSHRSSQTRLTLDRSIPFHTLPASLLLATAALKSPIIPGGPLPNTFVDPRVTSPTNSVTAPC